MALIVLENTVSVASALLRPDTKGIQATACACGRLGSWLAPLRFANAIVALSATSAFAACLVLWADGTQSNQKSHLQAAHQVATAGARKCWSSAEATARLVEKGVMSPSIISLDSATNGERDACSVLRARDATEDDCSMLVTVGGGGYFRLLYSGLYYVTVQVLVEAEAESGCIELVVVRRRPRSGKMTHERNTKENGKDRGQSCRANADGGGGAFAEMSLSVTKATLPGASVAAAAGEKANTTIYTSKLASLQSGDEISLKLRCFGVGTAGSADGKTGGCPLSVGRGSHLGLLPVELSSN